MSVDELSNMVDDDQYDADDAWEPHEVPADPEPEPEPGPEDGVEVELEDALESAQPELRAEPEVQLESAPAGLAEPAVPVEPVGEHAVPSATEEESVGHPDVDAVVRRLAELDQLPVDEHIDVYEDAHRRLHETLLAAGEDSGSA